MTAITVTTETPSTPTTTVTHYQQLANDFINALDEIAKIIPQLQKHEVAIAKFTRGQLGTPDQFCATAIAAVEQVPLLRAANRLDPQAARDTLQFLEAFRTVRDRVLAFAKDLKFTFDSRKATISVQSRDVYALAKSLARDKSDPIVEAHVANMKRDYGRRTLTKAQREERAKLKAAAAERQKEVQAKAA